MANPKLGTKSPTIRRIMREAHELSETPSADYTAAPLESDLFEWHFTFRGPPNCVYSDGIYHGKIVLPPTYPLRPPSFRFATPSGRFETNREICLSISDHHEETWQPAWGVRTALVALRSFMETDPRGQLGGLDTTDAVRRKLATESQSFRCSACGKTNQEIIRDCEERAVAAAVPASQIDVDIPADLKMAWKDELTNATTTQTPNPGAAPLPSDTRLDDDDKAGVLAEGRVETTPAAALAPQDSRQAQPVQGLQAATRGAHSRGSHPPTAISAPTVDPQPRVPLPHRTRNEQAVRRNSDDGVPAWIDRVIVALIVVLAALVLRVLFG